MSEERCPLTADLCDVWLDATDRRCDAYWRVEIDLHYDVRVAGRGGAVWGIYQAGTWRFCRMHARIFNRDRQDLPGPGNYDHWSPYSSVMPATWEVCETCNTWQHICGGCGEELTHGQVWQHYLDHHAEEEMVHGRLWLRHLDANADAGEA